MNILTENYKLYNGDCLEIMDMLIKQGIQVDAIITDPPYGTTQCKWDSIIPFDEMWARLNKLIKPNGAIVLFGSEPFSSQLRCSNIQNFRYDWIWDKVFPVGHLVAKHRPMQQTENISIFYKKGGSYNPQMIKLSEEEYKKKVAKLRKSSYDSKSELTPKHKELSVYEVDLERYKYKHPTNILTYNKLNKECNSVNRVHPTQKPVDLLEYLVKTYTNEGEIVLDFTMGSGSTGVACMNTNRKFIGIELDENYFNISINRIFENYCNK